MDDNDIRVCGASTSGTPGSPRRGHTRRSVHARILALLLAGRFDRALAVGVPAPIGSALAVHAARLTSVAERQAVAGVLRRAVRDAKGGRAQRSGGVLMHRANISSAEALINQVVQRLDAPHPVSVRGMARLRQLLSDGAGPLYRPGSGDLTGRLGAALAAL